MNFLVDDSTDARIAAHLTARGHDARLARDYQVGLPDTEVLAIAQREQRILITDDRDFGELVFRHLHPHAGVIYFRLVTTLLAVRSHRLDDVLANHAAQLDQFLVVTEQSVRIRPTPRR